MYIKITPILQIITTTKHVGYGNTINIEKTIKFWHFGLYGFIQNSNTQKTAKVGERRRKTTKVAERQTKGVFQVSFARRKTAVKARQKKTTKVERNTAKTASESERRRERCSGTSKTERINIHSGLSRPTPNEIVAKYTKQLNKIEKIIRNDLKDQLLLLQNAVAQQYQTNPSLTKRYCIFI